MLILGIETSGSPGSVSLLRDGNLLGEVTLDQTGVRHATNLVAEIDALLRRNEQRWPDVNLFAVSIGPGSFTGLRVGVVCAKTAAYGTGATVVGVDSFLAVAENAPPEINSVLVIADALRGDVYQAQYHRDPTDGHFQREGEVAIAEAKSLLTSLPTGTAVMGSGLKKYAKDVPAHCQLLEPPLSIPHAASIARLGERIFRTSGPHDLWGLEPLYLRKSGAEEKISF